MICSTCKLNKPADQFSFKNKEKGLRASICKPCHREYCKTHYENNSDSYKVRAIKSRPALIDKGKRYIIEYLQNHPCVDCGISDIRVLQFDHIENIGWHGRRVSNFVSSINRLKAEIEKCQVRCANCHMIKTGLEFGWR